MGQLQWDKVWPPFKKETPKVRTVLSKDVLRESHHICVCLCAQICVCAQVCGHVCICVYAMFYPINIYNFYLSVKNNLFLDTR